MTKIVGIYKIENTVNGKVYIGQSININDRWIRHRHHLKKGVHGNAHLQRSYNKYGSNCFEFNIIEECEKSNLQERELYWILYYKNLTYNMTYNTCVLSGKDSLLYGKKLTKEHKDKLSKIMTGRYVGKDNPNYGNKNTKETKRKMALNRSNRKLEVDDVRKIKSLLKDGSLSHSKIAKIFDITRTVITRINTGVRWAWVE